MTPEFRERSGQLQINLDEAIDEEQLHRWILAPLPPACGFCTAHSSKKYYPLCDVGSSSRLIDFAGEENRELLESGFSWLEPTGVWTEGETATMRIPPLDISNSPSPWVRLVFRLRGYVNARVPRMEVFIGSPDCDWKDRWEFATSDQKSFAEQGNYRSLFIPKTVFNRGEPFRLNFEIRHPHCPFESGTSNDKRTLEVFFEHIMADAW